MRNLIDKIYRILNACKGFKAGYSSDTASDGYFYLDYCPECSKSVEDNYR